MSTVHITPHEAIAAATEHAFTDEDGRATVHSVMIGSTLMLGADWDLDDLVKELNRAQEIVWFDDFMGHELAIKSADGHFYKFAVKRPGGVA